MSTELTTTGPRPVVPAHGRVVEDDGRHVKLWGLGLIAAMLALVIFFILANLLSKPVEVTITGGTSIIRQVNVATGLDQIADPKKRAKRELANYLTGIRLAEACQIPVYKALGSQPSAGFERITYGDARDAAKTTDWRMVDAPVYAGDVLSTRGKRYCREGNNIPFAQRER